MPVRILNITDDAHQQHTVKLGESEVIISLRFYPVAQMWALDATYKGRRALGVRIGASASCLESFNFPFDFKALDTSGAGLDPMRLDDFATGRVALYMLDAADMEVVRDAPVPV